MQTGHIYKKVNKKGKGSWYLRYWDDVILKVEIHNDNGKPEIRLEKKRKLCTRKIAPYPQYRSKDSVRPLAREFLEKFNNPRLVPGSAMTVAQFVESCFLPHIKKNNRASTFKSYRDLWRAHLAPRCGGMRLKDFRCMHAEETLDHIARQENLAHSSMRRIKAVLSSIFKEAKRKGILDGINPVKDASAKGKKVAQRKPYSPDEVMKMLGVLAIALESSSDAGSADKRHRLQQAIVAVSLAAFAGLRREEIPAVRWEDYNGQAISIKCAVWEGIVGEPKTDASAAPVPVAPKLASELDGFRAYLGNPGSGWILAGIRNGKPLRIENLKNRTILPIFKQGGIEWRGWHQFRHGVGTNLHATGADPKTIQAVLRHADVHTTMQIYVHSDKENSVKALQDMDDLFTKCSPDSL